MAKLWEVIVAQGGAQGAGGRPRRSDEIVASGPLTVAAVARELGIAAATLRTWDRRYGLGPTEREAGAHRRYSPEDVKRLHTMRRLTLQGVAPADAARIATQGEDGETGPAAPTDEDVIADPLSLAAAAVEEDFDRVLRTIGQEVAQSGVVAAWTGLVTPARQMLDSGRQRSIVEPGQAPVAIVEAATFVAVRHAYREAGMAAEAVGKPEGLRSNAEATDTLAPVCLYTDAAHRLRAHVIGGGLAQQQVASHVAGAEHVSAAELAQRCQDLRVLAVLESPPGAEDLIAAAQREGIDVFLLGRAVPEVWQPRVHRVRTVAAAVSEIAEVAAG